MQVGFRDLTLWSFLMASAHGAGLMLIPILLDWPQEHAGHLHAGVLSSNQMTALAGPLQWLVAIVVRSAGHLSMAVLIAVVVYEKLGLALLRRAWFNLDLVWMIALMMSGVLILLL